MFMQSPYSIEIDLIELICRGVDPRTGEVIRTPRDPRLDEARLVYLNLLRDYSASYCGNTAAIESRFVIDARKPKGRWTEIDDDRLRLQVEQGASVAQLADQFGRSQGAIWSRVSKLGLVVRVTAKSVELPKDPHQKSSPAPRWSTVEIDDLLYRWNASGSSRSGPDIKELSKLHQRSVFAIINRLHILGAVSIEEADALCVAVGAKKLVSEYERDAGRPLRSLAK